MAGLPVMCYLPRKAQSAGTACFYCPKAMNMGWWGVVEGQEQKWIQLDPEPDMIYPHFYLT